MNTWNKRWTPMLAALLTLGSLSATLRAGDMLGIGGQLVRIMADATADGTGAITIEFQPRARAAIAASSAVTWARPTANFMLKSADGVPTVWAPGRADGASVEFIEVP